MTTNLNSGIQNASKASMRLGVSLFVAGWLCPLLIPVVTATTLPTNWKTIISGALMLGIPEVLWIAAAAALGKKGFQELRSRLFRVFKRVALPERVGPVRYRLGLVMFACPLLFGWFEPYFDRIASEGERPSLVLNVVFDAMFLVSFFVLGGEFWDKLRALFVHAAKVQLSPVIEDSRASDSGS